MVQWEQWEQVKHRRQSRYAWNGQWPRAQAGQRLEEWECCTCGVRNYLDKPRCRGCSKGVHQGADIFINSFGKIASWPKTTQVLAHRPSLANPQESSTQKAGALQQARQQLQQARSAQFPEDVISMLQTRVAGLERVQKAAKPLGQRLDSARADLAKAVSKAEKAETQLEKARDRFTEAQEELMTAHALFITLSQETAAQPPCLSGEAQFTSQLVASLESLMQTVESSWTPNPSQPPPDRLVNAIQESRSILQLAAGILEGGDAPQLNVNVNVKEEITQAAKEGMAADTVDLTSENEMMESDVPESLLRPLAEWPTLEPSQKRQRAASPAPQTSPAAVPSPTSDEALTDVLKRAARLVPELAKRRASAGL